MALALPSPLVQVDRVWVRYRGRRWLYFGGCDYLRLATHPRILAAAHTALTRFGLNVAASRTTTGNHPVYRQLEHALARFFQHPCPVLVPAGYATNPIVAQALHGTLHQAWIDERAHPSLQDAAKLLDCPIQTFRHRDPDHVRTLLARRPAGPGSHFALLTDGLCARDGTIAPLSIYRSILPQDAWLWIDDAHGVGVLGSQGRGAPEHCGLGSGPLIHTFTLSKAFGTYGGVILAPRALASQIPHRSRQFAGCTPMPPALAAAATTAVTLVRAQPGLRRRLQANTTHVKQRLRQAGLRLPDTPSPIVAFEAPDPAYARHARTSLLRAGIFPTLIRYPGGPTGGYFRFALSSAHTAAHLERLCDTLLRLPRLRPME